MENIFKNVQKSSKGITLIALVITIIVLLILAGISISMLSGDNGILQRAVDSKEKTEKATIIESAKTDILGQIAENKGNDISKKQLATILNKQFKTVDESSIPDEISSTNDIELTTTDERYTINLSEIYVGRFVITTLEAGLYDATTDELKISWSDLISSGIIKVNDGELSTQATYDNTTYKWTNPSATTLDGKLIVSNDINKLADAAFINCTKLVEIVLPNGITIFGNAVFNGCTNLANINIPETVNSIGQGAFLNCTELSSIKVPDNVTTLENSIFWGCNKLVNLVLGNNITTIGMNAFGGCSFDNIILHNKITNIKAGAFSNCTNLKDVYYTGSEEEWNSITINEGNDVLTTTSVTIHYNYTE